jgi:micrococcal nuclease
MRARRPAVSAGALAIALLAALALAAPAFANEALVGVVVRIVDGDTVYVDLGDRVEKVRYIGMDTPETRRSANGGDERRRSYGEQPGGREATEVNRRLVEGRRVRLELDVRERDRYGRLLAYVYVGSVMVNAELVRLGYARLMTVPPNVRYVERFAALQREAREAGRGLWATSAAD